MKESLTLLQMSWPILAAAVAAMIVGGLWYAPFLFGKAWMKGAGFTEADLEKCKAKGMWKAYLLAFIPLLVMASVFNETVIEGSSSIAFTNFWEALRSTVEDGALFLWIGFIAPVMLGSVIWEQRSFKYYLINVFHWLAVLVVMGAVLAYGALINGVYVIGAI